MNKKVVKARALELDILQLEIWGHQMSTDLPTIQLVLKLTLLPGNTRKTPIDLTGQEAMDLEENDFDKCMLYFII